YVADAPLSTRGMTGRLTVRVSAVAPTHRLLGRDVPIEAAVDVPVGLNATIEFTGTSVSGRIVDPGDDVGNAGRVAATVRLVRPADDDDGPTGHTASFEVTDSARVRVCAAEEAVGTED